MRTKGGRPTKLTAEVAAGLATSFRAGATVESAAATAGISARTLRGWLARGAREEGTIYARLNEALRAAEAETEEAAVAAVRGAFGEDWKAASFWLTRRRPREWNPDVVRIAEESVELLLAAVGAEFGDDEPAILDRVLAAVAEYHAVSAAMPNGSGDEITAAYRRERAEKLLQRRNAEREAEARRAPPAPIRSPDEPAATFEARTKLWEDHYQTALSAESARESGAAVRVEGD